MTIITSEWSSLTLDVKTDIIQSMFASFEKEYTPDRHQQVMARYSDHATQVSVWKRDGIAIAYSIWWIEHPRSDPINDCPMFVYLDKLFVTIKQRGFGSEWFYRWCTIPTIPSSLVDCPFVACPIVLRTSHSLASGFYAKLGLSIIAEHDEHVYLTNKPKIVTTDCIFPLYRLPSCFV